MTQNSVNIHIFSQCLNFGVIIYQNLNYYTTRKLKLIIKLLFKLTGS